MLNFHETRIVYRKRPMIGWKSREITFHNTGKILLKQELDGCINIHEHKRYYYTFDNSLLIFI